MAAKTRGSKKRKAEGKKGDLSKKKKKENVLEAQEARQPVDEEGQRLKSEKGALTLTLYRLKDETGSARMAVSECETEIEELEATQKAALAKEQLETKALRAKTKKPKEFQGDENLLAKLTRQRIEWLQSRPEVVAKFKLVNELCN